MQYSNSLRVVRVQNSSVSNATESGSTFVIKNTTDYQNNYVDGSASVGLWRLRTAHLETHYRFLLVHLLLLTKKQTKQLLTDVQWQLVTLVVTVTSGTGISAGDIVNFGDQYEYRVVSVSTNDLNIVRKEEPQHFVELQILLVFMQYQLTCSSKTKMEILRLI